MMESTFPNRTEDGDGEAVEDDDKDEDENENVGTAAPGCPAGRSPAAALPSTVPDRPRSTKRTPAAARIPRALDLYMKEKML